MTRSSTVRITYLCSALLFAFLPGITAAQTEPDKQADAALAKLATNKRAAAFKLILNPKPGEEQYTFGVFISKNGLALVPLSAVTLDYKPQVISAEGAELEFGKILRLYPEQELALLKFAHNPTEFFTIAKSEPEIGETVALVPMKNNQPRFGKTPPVIGDIMTKRSKISTGLKKACFVKSLSLGAGLSVEQRSQVIIGSFAINTSGELAAFFGGTIYRGNQLLILLTPVAALSEQIGRIEKDTQTIKHPIPDALNPADPAIIDEENADFYAARQRRDLETALRIYKNMLNRHPESPYLITQASSLVLEPDGGLCIEMENIPSPEAEELGEADKCVRHSARFAVLYALDDEKGALNELKAAVKYSPEDFPEMRYNLSFFLREDASATEKLYREVYPYMSDTILFVEQYESLLNDLGKSQEADKMSERFWELDEIYRRRRGEDE